MSFCVCSISKMCRMSRTILEPEEDRFGYANGPPPKGFSPLQRSTNSCALRPLEIVIPPRAGHFSTLRLLASLQRRNSRFALKQSSLRALRCGGRDYGDTMRHHVPIMLSCAKVSHPGSVAAAIQARCVLFNTSPPCMSAHFTPGPSRPPEPAGPFRSRRKEKKPRLDIHDHIVYIGFILRVRRPFRRRTGSRRSSKPVVGMVIAVILTFSARLCLRRGEKIGA